MLQLLARHGALRRVMGWELACWQGVWCGKWVSTPGEEEVKLRATIRIIQIVIQIPHEEQVKRLKHGFESPTQRFESLMKNKVRRFESLSYGFESLHK